MRGLVLPSIVLAVAFVFGLGFNLFLLAILSALFLLGLFFMKIFGLLD